MENVGRDTLLVSAIQARNNARAVFSGSMELFSNQYFTAQLTSSGKVRTESYMGWIQSVMVGHVCHSTHMADNDDRLRAIVNSLWS